MLILGKISFYSENAKYSVFSVYIYAYHLPPKMLGNIPSPFNNTVQKNDLLSSYAMDKSRLGLMYQFFQR